MSLLKTLFSRSRPSWPTASDEDWLLTEKPSNDGISLLRIRKLPAEFSFRDFGHRLSVTWTYQQKVHDGAPAEDEVDFMQRFEARVADGVERHSAALLALVFTEPGFRQFEYYGPSRDKFIKLLNRVPQDDVRYPITIAHENDPDGRLYWSYARGLVGES